MMHDDFEEDQEELVDMQMRQERMRMLREGDNDQGSEEATMQNMLNFNEQRGHLSAWLNKPEVIKSVHRQFNMFLRNFKNEDGTYVYEERIHEMCRNNQQSLEINFPDLSQQYPTMAIWLAEEPSIMLNILNEVAVDIVTEVYPDYHKIHEKIYIRVGGLPVEDKLRDLRQVHLNALIKIRGVVTKRTAVFPEMKEIYFKCARCSDVKGPFYNTGDAMDQVQSGSCVRCQYKGKYEVEESKCVYRNYQKWTVQETPGSVPPGRVPR